MNNYKLLPLSALFLLGNMNAQMDSTRVEKEVEPIIITGTIKPMSKSKSPVPVEVYSPKFFRQNPTANIIDAIGMINGIRQQIDCAVCNTENIRINGLEGPYTMVLIDGMPIVSSLSTVYGLSGIPQSMVERIEVVKGPASTLYGSEAIAGMINIITKNALTAPTFTGDVYGTSWGEVNTDLGVKFNVGEKASSLLSLNYYHFDTRIDKNEDNFMDKTLQKRISLFNKWNFQREEGRQASLAFRYMYEDRVGGEMQWKKEHRGGDEVYAESIYTNRFEAIATYQLPLEEKVFTQLSYNYHNQDSYYGTEPYMGKQEVAFGQIYWNPTWGDHDVLIGSGLRYNYYDDNTPGTLSADGKTNAPQRILLPGVFVQNQWTINPENTLLLGYRFDYDRVHKAIHSPRVAWKTHLGEHHIRTSFGTGFRVVNLFTEDHRALTGAR
ncbi:MAG: TonB-dependent receptor, partial [Flavobacteriaceae bacterium]|nr:TonB-dependent receptor [Flavobacteriaceae bacterium]